MADDKSAMVVVLNTLVAHMSTDQIDAACDQMERMPLGEDVTGAKLIAALRLEVSERRQ